MEKTVNINPSVAVARACSERTGHVVAAAVSGEQPQKREVFTTTTKVG